jgi:hypothetical protein
LSALGAAVFALSGPDELRNLIGRERTLRIAGYAGIDPAGMAAGWDDQERAVMRQASTRMGEDYSQDPAHDPRVTDAIMAGMPMAEISRIRQQVTAKYRERARAAAEGRQPRAVAGPAAGLEATWRGLDGPSSRERSQPPRCPGSGTTGTPGPRCRDPRSTPRYPNWAASRLARSLGVTCGKWSSTAPITGAIPLSGSAECAGGPGPRWRLPREHPGHDR